MADSPEILVTNDDGIDAPGIRALAAGLRDVGNVTVVAPADNQSATGRAMSREVTVDEHELGYAIGGTPSDCVVAGLEAIGPYPDLVVSGVNEGANLGMYVLGRSGTVSAAVEAAFFGVPAIATSLFLTSEDFGSETHPGTTRLRSRRQCTSRSSPRDRRLRAGRLPERERTPPRRRTLGRDESDAAVPRLRHDRRAERRDSRPEGPHVGPDGLREIPDPAGTDRRAVVDGHVSVSPLTAPHTTEHHEALDGLADAY